MKKFNPVIEDNPNPDFEFPTSMQPIIFSSDNNKLIGTFFVASGKEKKPTVMLLHGFPGNETNYDIAHAIKRFGFNVIIFHYSGTWGSSGDFSITNAISDVNVAVNYFCNELPNK